MFQAIWEYVMKKRNYIKNDEVFFKMLQNCFDNDNEDEDSEFYPGYEYKRDDFWYLCECPLGNTFQIDYDTFILLRDHIHVIEVAKVPRQLEEFFSMEICLKKGTLGTMIYTLLECERCIANSQYDLAEFDIHHH